jgi:hypothetical protein
MLMRMSFISLSWFISIMYRVQLQIFIDIPSSLRLFLQLDIVIFVFCNIVCLSIYLVPYYTCFLTRFERTSKDFTIVLSIKLVSFLLIMLVSASVSLLVLLPLLLCYSVLLRFEFLPIINCLL